MRSRVQKPHPVAKRGVKFQQVACKCGYVGRSQYPEFYQCSACIYEAHARAERIAVLTLRERADRREKEADRFAELAQRWRVRNDRAREGIS